MTEAPSLLADIGGTHARFALSYGGQTPDQVMVLRCREFPGPVEAAMAFLANVSPKDMPSSAVWGVAAAIAGDRVYVPNSGWDFTVSGVRDKMGLKNVHFINDFAAVALSLGCFGPADLMPLGVGKAVAGMPVGVLGPGTGLGVSAVVTAAGGEQVVLDTEGGHVTMAAVDDFEAKVLAFIRRKYGHVSAERVISGPGLVNLYQAIAALEGKDAVLDRPDHISGQAVEGTCPLCIKAVDLFFAMLGTVAGDLALTLGARGGIYIAGGIVPRMQSLVGVSKFRARFEAKGRFREYLSEIPTWLVIHPQPAFAGLALLARRGQSQP